MRDMQYDDWQSFLEERGQGPSWQWPFNLAVALHLAVFGSAVVLQNMTGSSPGLKLDNAVMVNFISLSASRPLSVAPPSSALPAAEPPPAELIAGVQRKISTQEAKPKAEVNLKKPMVKEVLTPKEEIAASVKRPIELKPDTVKKTAEPEVVQQPAPKIESAPAVKAKKAVSLNPVKLKEEKKVQQAEAKAREQAKAAEMKRQAEAKKQEAVNAANKIEAEKKDLKEKEAAKLAEAKKKEAEAARREAEKKAAAAELRKKLADQTRRQALVEAQRIEREAAAAQQAAAAAKEQLVRALRENAAVSTAAAASRGSLLGTDSGHGRISAAVSTVGLNQYARQLNEQISSRWKVPEFAAGNRKLKMMVALTVNRNGTIEKLQIEQKSGDPLFDQSVIQALRSAPLPKFSAVVTEQDRLEFALNFTPQGLTL